MSPILLCVARKSQSSRYPRRVATVRSAYPSLGSETNSVFLWIVGSDFSLAYVWWVLLEAVHVVPVSACLAPSGCTVHSCEQQLDLSVVEHDQREVTNGMPGNFLLMWPQRVLKRGSNPKPAQSLVVHQKKSLVLALRQKEKKKVKRKVGAKIYLGRVLGEGVSSSSSWGAEWLMLNK